MTFQNELAQGVIFLLMGRIELGQAVKNFKPKNTMINNSTIFTQK